MKYSKILIQSVIISAVLCSCSSNINDVSENSTTVTDITAETSAAFSSVQEIQETQKVSEYSEPEGILKAAPENFPVIDGSTSATALDAAIRAAYLGGFTAEELEPFIFHTTTYESFSNLLNKKADAIYTVEISDSQREEAERNNFRIKSIPVAKEAFVFIVNRNNPVKSLSQEQLKDIFSGKITNWSEVGGNNAEIKVFLRNANSGSSNYLNDFLGDTEPVSGERVYYFGSMGGITDFAADYENGIDSIGISVYSYVTQIDYDDRKPDMIAVDGIEPNPSTLSDDSYPLMSYTYFMYSADLPEDSEVKKLAEFIKTPEAQNAVEACGYVRAYN